MQRGPGRKKGQEGVARREIRRLLADAHPDWHPALQLAEIARDPESNKELQASCCKEILQYLCPKLRSVEHTGEGDGGLVIKIVDATAAAKE
jgi:hypothetical protein